MTTVTDTFTRADRTDGLGTTETGGLTWQFASAATWGISSNRAYIVNPVNDSGGQAYLAIGQQDAKIEARFSTPALGRYQQVIVRFNPATNEHYRCYAQAGNGSGNTLEVYREVPGNSAMIYSGGATFANGDLIALETAEEAGGTRVRLFKNGSEVWNTLDTGTRPAGTNVGLAWYRTQNATTSYWDDVTVTYTASASGSGAGSVIISGTAAGPYVPTTSTRREPAPFRLGSGDNRAFLFDRGGSNRIGAFRNYQQVRWSRRRDDISSSTLIVDPNECDDVLDKMNGGRHEIVIVRNGRRVWEGPITRITEKARTIEITAHDIWHYANRTAMRAAYDNRYSTTGSRVAPVTTRAHTILVNELSRKEALGYNLLQHLRVITSDITANTSRLSYPYEWEVWEEIDYMAAKLGLDYTAVGRSMVLFGVYEDIGRTALLTDADFQDELVVTHYGMELATHAAVSDGEGRYAAVGANHDYYGEVELVNEVYGEGVDFADPDNPTTDELEALSREMTSQAQRNLTGRLPLPAVVRVPDGTALNPNAPITMEQLVPGVRVPVRATRLRRAYQQVQKLDTLDVTQDESGEKVSVTLSPAPGTSPWDDSVETAGDEED